MKDFRTDRLCHIPVSPQVVCATGRRSVPLPEYITETALRLCRRVARRTIGSCSQAVPQNSAVSPVYPMFIEGDP